MQICRNRCNRVVTEEMGKGTICGTVLTELVGCKASHRFTRVPLRQRRGWGAVPKIFRERKRRRQTRKAQIDL